MRVKTIIIPVMILLLISTVLAAEQTACVALSDTQLIKMLEEEGYTLGQAEAILPMIKPALEKEYQKREEQASKGAITRTIEASREALKTVLNIILGRQENLEQRIRNGVNSLLTPENLNRVLLEIRVEWNELIKQMNKDRREGTLAQKRNHYTKEQIKLIHKFKNFISYYLQQEKRQQLEELLRLSDLYGELPESGILNLKGAYGRLMNELMEKGTGVHEIDIDFLKIDLKSLNARASGDHTKADEWKNEAYNKFKEEYEKIREAFFGAYQKNMGAFSIKEGKVPEQKPIITIEHGGETILEVYEVALSEEETKKLEQLVKETEKANDQLGGNLGIIPKKYVVNIITPVGESVYSQVMNALFKQFLVTSHLERFKKKEGKVTHYSLREVFEKVAIENKQSNNYEESGEIMESFELGKVTSSALEIKKLTDLINSLEQLTTAETEEDLTKILIESFAEKQKLTEENKNLLIKYFVDNKITTLPKDLELEFYKYTVEVFDKKILFEILKRNGMRLPSGHEKFPEIKGKALMTKTVNDINLGTETNQDLINIDVHDMGKTNVAQAVNLIQEFYNTYEIRDGKFYDTKTGEEISEEELFERFKKLLEQMGKFTDEKLKIYLELHGHPRNYFQKTFLDETKISALKKTYYEIYEEQIEKREVEDFVTALNNIFLTGEPSEELKKAYQDLKQKNPETYREAPENMYDDLLITRKFTIEMLKELTEILSKKEFTNPYVQELKNTLQHSPTLEDIIKQLIKISLFTSDKYGPGGDEVVGIENHEITGLLNILSYLFTSETDKTTGKLSGGLRAGAGAYTLNEKERQQTKFGQYFSTANQKSEQAGIITKIVKATAKITGKTYFELFSYKLGEELSEELKEDLINVLTRAFVNEEVIEGINDNDKSLLKIFAAFKALDENNPYALADALGIKEEKNIERIKKLNEIKTKLEQTIKDKNLESIIPSAEDIANEGLNDFDEGTELLITDKIIEEAKATAKTAKDYKEDICKAQGVES